MGPAWGMGHTQTCQVVLDILSRCPKLETCKLLVHDPQDVHLEESIVECPSIHTFDLQSAGAPLLTSGRLLSRLSLPELRDFKLRGQAELQGVFAVDALVSSLAASTHLASVSIDSDSFTKSSLTDFLRGLPPTILRLQITDRFHTWQLSPSDGSLDDDVLKVLNASPEDHLIHCPALQELVMLHCRKISDEALGSFIISRMPILRVVDVKFDRERQVDILPSLESFLEAGLQTSITYISLMPPQFSPWQGLPDPPPGQWGQGGWGWPSSTY
ncbi:hypothetical protein MVEN_00838800 [Mycena venus]|uniref:F-box domain-containing protein n=1 Tax=Mycena venus TaxID=2733690 RepID=A0A8H7D0Y0_9AGAR|nr:hypothetical protein MVEN_00838800 [Mycena venus]